MADPRDRYAGVELMMVVPAVLLCVWPGIPAAMMCILSADDFSVGGCGYVVAMVALGGFGIAALIRLILFGLATDGHLIPWVVVGLLCGVAVAAPMTFLASRAEPLPSVALWIVFGLPLLVASRRLHLEHRIARDERAASEGDPATG